MTTRGKLSWEGARTALPVIRPFLPLPASLAVALSDESARTWRKRQDRDRGCPAGAGGEL